MLIYFQSILAIILCFYSSITDIKSKKIYNKIILIALVVSSSIYAIFYKEINTDVILNHFINCIITLIMSFLFFYFKIWAAGDAKLFWVISFILPFSIYETSEKNVFPSIYLLMMTFGVAFVYVVIETIFLWIKDKEKFKKSTFFSFEHLNLQDFIIQYFSAYFLILIINNILNKFFVEFIRYNGTLILISNMLLITFIYRVLNNRKKYILLLVISIISNIIYIIAFGFTINQINIKMIFLVAFIFIFRQISEKYNYEKIEVENLKSGMILAYQSVIRFYGSKVKNLPETTTETTKSRLTQEQVDSIKRWSKTKKGDNEIIIVRYMPFAPFILVGTVIYLIIKVIL